MKLRTAVIVAASLLSGAFGLLSAVLISTTDLLDSQSRELARAGESIRVAQSLKNRLLVHNRNVFLYEVNNDPSRFESLDAHRLEIEALLREAEMFINNDEEKLVFERVREETRAYLDRREQYDQTGSSALTYDVASVDADNAISIVDELVMVNRTQMEQLATAIGMQNERTNVIAGTLFVFGAMTLAGVAFAIFRFITRPLTRLARVITTISAGGSATRIEPTGATEIQTVISNFNSMTERLEEKRKDQLRFIASIAHDLRNPLNSMSISTDLMLRQEHAENRRFLEVIDRQVKNLDRLVNDLLDTTHIESGHLALRPVWQDIGPLVQDAVELQRVTSGVHQFRLELAEGLNCKCDNARLSQVVNNLLSNAIKYSPNGGAITLNAWNDIDWIHISVSDHGIGIDPEDRESIFRPFQRSKATKETIPGIGLGLSTSRRIVEAHGGRLTVTSEPGNGSTFVITLPCNP